MRWCAAPATPDGSWDPQDAQGRAMIAEPTPETKQPALEVGLRHRQIRAGAADPDAHRRLRHGRCGAAPLERLRPGAGAVEPLHRGARDLRLAAGQNGERPMVFEDGQQQRDFRPCRSDVARAFVLALDHRGRAGRGVQHRQRRGCARWRRSHWLQRPLHEPGGASRRRSPSKTRLGDIRHCMPDLAKARRDARLRAPAGLRRRPGRTRPMGRAAAGHRPGGAGPRRTREPGAWSRERVAGRPAGPARVRSWSPAAPASSAATSPTGWPPTAMRSSSTTCWPARAWNATWTG